MKLPNTIIIGFQEEEVKFMVASLTSDLVFGHVREEDIDTARRALKRLMTRLVDFEEANK